MKGRLFLTELGVLILDKPINLFNSNTASVGDLIRVTASAASDLECFVSVLEITN